MLIGLDRYSRRLFNEFFYREYRGFSRSWLEGLSERLFAELIRPEIYPGAKALLDADRADGYRLVLVTGALDFDLVPVVRYFRFDGVISNSLVFNNGAATGRIADPLIAEHAKRDAVLRWCREYNIDPGKSKAYSDSFSDLPLLEAVGRATAVNPDRRLRRVALERGWPIMDLRSRGELRQGRDRARQPGDPQ